MTWTSRDIAAAANRCAAAFRVAEDRLNAADGKLGDGDTGQTMRRLAETIAAAAAAPPDDIGDFLRKLGLAGTTATGSSLGTLVSIGLMEMGKGLRGRTGFTLDDTVAALGAAEAAMLARGGAALGDKTALDVLHAVRGALESAPRQPDRTMVAAAEETLASFRGQPCRIGRARMFAERSVGLDDPGMLAFATIVEALAAGGAPAGDGSRSKGEAR